MVLVPEDQDKLKSIFGGMATQLATDESTVLSRTTFRYFNQYIFGELNNIHHTELCDALDTWEDIIGILPRNSAKTTIAPIRYPAYRLGQDRGLRIIIGSVTATLAESFGRSIESIFKLDKYRAIFGNMIPAQGSAKWNESEKVVADRPERNSLGFRTDDKDASIFCVGVGGAIVGRRADILILDDIIDRRHVKTDTQLADVKHWFNEELKGVRHRKTQTVIVGTRWSARDLYIENISNMIKRGAQLAGNMNDEVLDQVRQFNAIADTINL